MAKTSGNSKFRLFALCLALLLALWHAGLVGLALRPVLWMLLPRLERHFDIVYHGKAPAEDPKVGISLTVSEGRLRQAAREALGWKARLIPPGLIPPRYNFSGVLKSAFNDDPLDLPLVLKIDPAHTAPILKLRLPSSTLNELLDYDGSFTEHAKRHRYMLGHYETTLWIEFDTLEIESRLSPRELGKPITFRRIEGEATGTVRYRMKDSFARKTITAKVRSMKLQCDLEFRQYLDGLSLSYDITIPELDADIKKLAPFFEEKPVETLRKKLEHSLARPRKIQKVARHRLPLAIPRDLALDIRVEMDK